MAFLSPVAVPLMLAGTGLAAAGQISSGIAAGRAADFNARVAEQNAELERWRSARDERLFRRDARRLQGKQRAAIAKSGVTTAGSPLEVLAETAAQAEEEALAIRFGGNVAHDRAKAQASLHRFEGRQRRLAGALGAGSSLLTGAARALS